MPKLGMEPIRRAALVDATIVEIGQAGTLDITVSQIAKRAGMSSALAHHYFGGKEDIFAAAMRHILSDLQKEAQGRLKTAETALARVRAIIDACFTPVGFDPVNVNAWMIFYVQSRTSVKARRLLRIYHRRLHSNLCHALRPISANPEADAETLAALIDGIYLHQALSETGSAANAAARAHGVLDALLGTAQ
ncbi:MAG: transcriptional regulator BetI [Aliishimia sp.]